MTEQQYNEFFRSRMDAFSSPVPDHIWNEVEPKIIEQKRNRLSPAKYILLLFSLIVAVKTSDNLTGSGRQQTAFSINPARDKTNNIDSAAQINVIMKNSVGNLHSALQTTNLGFFKKGNTTRKQPPFRLRRENRQGNSPATLEETMKNSQPVASVFSMPTDGIAGNTIARKKNPALQNQPDSSVDITVEMHSATDRLSVSVFVSPDAFFSHVSAAGSSYAQQRNREAKPQFSWSAGIRFSYHIGDRWSASIGIQYSAINQKITLTDRTSRNHYTSIDMPVIAGYRVYKKKISVNINAGIMVNISSSYKGYISSVTNQPLDVHDANVYRSNTSLSYYGGIRLLYQPAKRIALFAEPYVKYQPQNIASSFQPFEEKIQKTGVLAGVRYRLSK